MILANPKSATFWLSIAFHWAYTVRMSLSKRILESFKSRCIIPWTCSSVVSGVPGRAYAERRWRCLAWAHGLDLLVTRRGDVQDIEASFHWDRVQWRYTLATSLQSTIAIRGRKGSIEILSGERLRVQFVVDECAYLDWPLESRSDIRNWRLRWTRYNLDGDSWRRCFGIWQVDCFVNLAKSTAADFADDFIVLNVNQTSGDATWNESLSISTSGALDFLRCLRGIFGIFPNFKYRERIYLRIYPYFRRIVSFRNFNLGFSVITNFQFPNYVIWDI